MTKQRTARRFIAVIGFVETPTNDRYPRLLRKPQPGASIRPDTLIPVLQVVEGRRMNVGTIYDVVILGNQLIALGYLGVETAGDEVRVESIRSGELFMELDVTSARIEEGTFGAELYGWRVQAVHLGTSPAWVLPSVHIWEK